MNVRIAYLVSRYPAISHSFILREVLALRLRGFEIHTASINRPDRPFEQLTEEERQETESTFFIKSAGAKRILAAHLSLFIRSPRGFIAGIFCALRLPGSDLHALLFNLFYFIEAVLLNDWMRRKRLHHVHVHFATPAATVAMIAGRMGTVSFSLTVHGPDEFYNVDSYYLAEKIRRATFVCAISQFCRSQLMKLTAPELWHKLEVCPLGVDPELFFPGNRKPAAEFRLLCVGRLVAAKGQAILLKAVAHLTRGGHHLSLTLVGDGPDRKGLEKLALQLGIAGRVTFSGSIDQGGIREFYRRADAFVLPSFAEGVPVVLMEAMASGVPCVTTAIAGIPELITSGRDGILVPPSDAKLLADAILLLKESPELCDRLANEGRRKVSHSYDLETNVDRLASVFARHLKSTLPSTVQSEAIA
jgi:colanic acid/amylovoran biosynthesis glycosyltransferase